MKRIIVISVSLIMATVCLNAQTVKKGSTSFLKGQSAFQVEYVFKDALVSNTMSIESYARSKSSSEENVTRYMSAIDKERIDLMMYFIDQANRNVSQVSFGANIESEYRIVVSLVSIDREGRYNTTDVSFVNVKTGEVAALVEFKCRGGYFGTFANLMGDAFKRDFTPNFISYLNKCIE